jgi:outer membrane protein TolC
MLSCQFKKDIIFITTRERLPVRYSQRNIIRNLSCSILLTLYIGLGDMLHAQNLGLDQVIQTTVANNPRIKVSLQSLEFTRGSMRIARSPFNTNIGLTGEGGREFSPNSIEGTTAPTESNYWFYTLSASKKFGFGTTVTPAVGVYSYGNQADNREVNEGTAFLTIEQPVLRGLGAKYTMANLRVAELNLNSQENQYLYDASAYLLEALSAYLEYLGAQQNLNIQLMTEEAMQETVRIMSRLVELDAVPGSELVVSEANLANQQVSTALAQNRLSLSQNVLSQIMGISVEELAAMGSPLEEFPVITSPIIVNEGYTTRWQQKSLSTRNDYLATVKDQEASLVNLDFAKRGMLPRLDLILGAGYNGIYQSTALDQYYQPFLSNIPGMNYNVGLRFNIAPRYDYEKGLRIQALAQNEAANQGLRDLELLIKREVQQDCDQIKYLLGATQSVLEAVEFSQQALENEKKKLNLGFSTAFNVALMQNNYLNAREREVALIQQLNLAIIRFKHHTGTLLEATGNSTFTVNSAQLFLLPEAP